MARGIKGSSSTDRILIPQSVGNVKEEDDIAAEMSDEEEAAYNSDEDMPHQQEVLVKKQSLIGTVASFVHSFKQQQNIK